MRQSTQYIASSSMYLPHCKHLLEVATIDGQEYVFNDLSLTNDDLAESNANKLGIKKNVGTGTQIAYGIEGRTADLPSYVD